MHLTENGRELQYIPGKTALSCAEDDPEFVQLPSNIKPINVTRRRHTNINDIDMAFNEVMSGNAVTSLQSITSFRTISNHFMISHSCIPYRRCCKIGRT